MKVAVVGATGNAGRRIVAELVRRGHTVTAIARRPEISGAAGVTTALGDVGQPTALSAVLRGHDAVVSAVRFVDTDPATLIGAVRASGVRRYIVVGGAGTLEVSPGVRLMDTPAIPDAYRPEVSAGAAFLQALRDADDLEWTFLSPSALFFAGERTGRFRLGRDELLTGEGGSRISYEDFAVALVDELERPAHIRQRFTVGY